MHRRSASTAIGVPGSNPGSAAPVSGSSATTAVGADVEPVVAERQRVDRRRRSRPRSPGTGAPVDGVQRRAARRRRRTAARGRRRRREQQLGDPGGLGRVERQHRAVLGRQRGAGARRSAPSTWRRRRRRTACPRPAPSRSPGRRRPAGSRCRGSPPCEHVREPAGGVAADPGEVAAEVPAAGAVADRDRDLSVGDRRAGRRRAVLGAQDRARAGVPPDGGEVARTRRRGRRRGRSGRSARRRPRAPAGRSSAVSGARRRRARPARPGGAGWLAVAAGRAPRARTTGASKEGGAGGHVGDSRGEWTVATAVTVTSAPTV